MIACKLGFTSIASYLIKIGTSVNKVNCNRQTAVHLAARHNHHEIVKTLVKAGADITIRDNLNYRPLDLALLFVNDKKDKTISILIDRLIELDDYS
jgi:ankyrin repeat protein